MMTGCDHLHPENVPLLYFCGKMSLALLTPHVPLRNGMGDGVGGRWGEWEKGREGTRTGM